MSTSNRKSTNLQWSGCIINRGSVESQNLWLESLCLSLHVCVCVCMNLLDRLTGCSPTMASCEWKDQESSSCSAPRDWATQLVFCVCWNLEEVGSNAREGMGVLTRPGQAGKERTLPSSTVTRRDPDQRCAFQPQGLN